MIKRYYKIHGHPIGYVEAESDGSHIRLGWSFCNPKDAFSKKKARLITQNRRVSDKYVIKDVQDAQKLFDNNGSLRRAEILSKDLLYGAKGDIWRPNKVHTIDCTQYTFEQFVFKMIERMQKYELRRDRQNDAGDGGISK